MRFPKASIHYWLIHKFGGKVVGNAKQCLEFIREVETWSDDEFVKASVEGDFGSAEVTTRDELIAKLWDYAVGPPVK